MYWINARRHIHVIENKRLLFDDIRTSLTSFIQLNSRINIPGFYWIIIAVYLQNVKQSIEINFFYLFHFILWEIRCSGNWILIFIKKKRVRITKQKKLLEFNFLLLLYLSTIKYDRFVVSSPTILDWAKPFFHRLSYNRIYEP